MATWDKLDLRLAGWYKIVGDSRDVPWQLGTTGTWDWQGSRKFLGYPMANWNNWDLILSTTRNIPCSPNCLRCHNMSTLTCYGSPGCLCSILP